MDNANNLTNPLSKSVLVVDDSPMIRKQVSAALVGSGLEVSTAVDGVDGAEKIKAGGVDCVVSDVKMPNRSGIEMLREIKSEPRFANLPVIMLTTQTERSLIVEAKAAGACAWLVKPFNPEILLAAVKKVVGVTKQVDITTKTG